MNLLKDLPSAVRAMTAVECGEHGDREAVLSTKLHELAIELLDPQEGPRSQYGLPAALHALRWREHSRVTEHPLFIMYGNGGAFRWILRHDGSVEFSAWHARGNPEALERARKEGFKIL